MSHSHIIAGIFEEYNKSIQVLHALSKVWSTLIPLVISMLILRTDDWMYVVTLHFITQVNTTSTIVENFRITHSTDHEQAAYLYEHVVFNDRYDNLIYEAAKKIFTEEIEFIQSTYNTT